MENKPTPQKDVCTPPAPALTPAQLADMQARNRRRTRGAFGARPSVKKGGAK